MFKNEIALVTIQLFGELIMIGPFLVIVWYLPLTFNFEFRDSLDPHGNGVIGFSL